MTDGPGDQAEQQERQGGLEAGPPDERAGQSDAEDLGYEEARDQLVEVVRQLEAGGLTLEQSLVLWERGEHLARVCEQRLDGARARLEAALGGDEGNAAPGRTSS